MITTCATLKICKFTLGYGYFLVLQKILLVSFCIVVLVNGIVVLVNGIVYCLLNLLCNIIW